MRSFTIDENRLISILENAESARSLLDGLALEREEARRARDHLLRAVESQKMSSGRRQEPNPEGIAKADAWRARAERAQQKFTEASRDLAGRIELGRRARAYAREHGGLELRRTLETY